MFAQRREQKRSLHAEHRAAAFSNGAFQVIDRAVGVPKPGMNVGQMIGRGRSPGAGSSSRRRTSCAFSVRPLSPYASPSCASQMSPPARDTARSRSVSASSTRPCLKRAHPSVAKMRASCGSSRAALVAACSASSNLPARRKVVARSTRWVSGSSSYARWSKAIASSIPFEGRAHAPVQVVRVRAVRAEFERALESVLGARPVELEGQSRKCPGSVGFAELGAERDGARRGRQGPRTGDLVAQLSDPG